ncbi:MAG: dephospho-CoA kinase [Alphaproteobacteria bacterium]
MAEKKLIIIGLTGSIATGKSVVADILQSHGFAVFDADEATKELSTPHGSAYPDIIKQFPMVVLPDGTIDRKKLADIVFADKEKLARLENILHPWVKILREKFYAKAKQQGKKIVFIVVPLLFEKNIDQECDQIWLMVSSSKNQMERAMKRQNMNQNLLQKILANQMPDDKKIKHVDMVIENNDTLSALEENILCAIKAIDG